MGRYLDIAKKVEAKRQAEAASSPPAPDLWLCEQCGKEVEIEDVCRSVDGQRWLTLWRCSPCQSYGVTPDTLRQPPAQSFLTDGRERPEDTTHMQQEEGFTIDRWIRKAS